MSDYDADVALAISLSLQEQKGRVSNPHDDPIVISDSSDEEEETDRLSKNASTARASGSKSIPKPLPSRKPATSLSKRLDDPSNIIDLDTTLEIEDIDTDTQHEDTATEDESDDEPAIASTKNRRKRETTSVSSSQVKTSSAANRSKSAAPNSFLAGKDTVPTPALSPMTAFRTERAKMEQERIARLKRLRPQTEKRDRISDGEETDDSDRRPSKRPSPALTSSSAGSSSKGKGKPTTPKGSFNVPDKSGLFWYGAVRQTANKHVTPSQDTKPIFRLTEILPPPNIPTSDPDKTLSFAILASYSTDLPWLYSLFSPDVPVILVAQPGQDGRAEVHHALPNWVRASPALAGGRGCMHVKMMLLFYKSGRLRVVIPTGNFLPHDWRDIENSVWLQDVPLRTGPVPVPAPIPSASQLHTDATQSQGFGERLEFVLKGLNVAPALEAHLIDQRASGEVRLPLRNIGELHARWDWSLVTAYLVPSIAGKHTGWPVVLQVGHTALMKAIRDMGAASDQVKIECQGSSIGSYSTAWSNEFMSSARGVSPEKWLDTPKAHRSKVPHPPDMKIVFPSLSTVDQSALGRPGGGTIFCQRRQWDASTFPKELFVDSNSKRGKVLMHSKMILGLVDGEERNPKGWLYVGSHNFTPSAWGNLSGSGFTPIMNITNYELGVVIALDKAVQGDELVCWKRPPRAYVKGKDLPWMQTEHM